jgi:hypothetical protein
MYVETQTKRLAQTVFLFSTASLCAILICMAATARHNVPVRRSVNFPVYTYQNPFHGAHNASSAASSEAKTVGIVAQLTSVKSLLGLSGLGALWLASTWYFQGGRNMKKRVHRHASYATPAKMNPLAILPEPVIPAPKEDIFRPSVFCGTTTSRLLAHGRTTAPCQSRFRPIILVASQTRVGRL